MSIAGKLSASISISQHRGPCSVIPKPVFRDITCSLPLEESADLLKLTSSGAGVIQQVAELAGIRFDFLDILLEARVALQDQDLVFGSTSLSYSVHWKKS